MNLQVRSSLAAGIAVAFVVALCSVYLYTRENPCEEEKTEKSEKSEKQITDSLQRPKD